jgi:lipoprotein-anchoring transpeptidase ErfK/SrfK
MRKMLRIALILSIPLILADCTFRSSKKEQKVIGPTPEQQAMYGTVHSESHVIPPVNLAQINPRFYRQVVDYHTSYAPGTIVVDTSKRFLYLVQHDGKAIRYGVGVGRAGFLWSGTGVIGRKSKWPYWTPTPMMIGRDPSLAKYAGGMEPGIHNSLGARALYLYSGGRDTMYRIHGTNEPWSIGTAISSGCIRMINQDVIDLYDRVGPGTRVIVLRGQMPLSLMYPTRHYVMEPAIP